jgi:hypothetical protein
MIALPLRAGCVAFPPDFLVRQISATWSDINLMILIKLIQAKAMMENQSGESKFYPN